MKNSTALLLLHMIVVLWGFTSILGVLIHYDSVPLVWWRLGVTVISLALYLLLSKKKLTLTRKSMIQISLVGLIVAIHWLFLYAGFKMSNISITMIAFSSNTLFTALIEPIFYKRKINKTEVLIGIGIFFSIAIIAINEIENTENALIGLVFGTIAAITASLFSTINGVLIKKSDSFSITFIELSSAFIWVSIGMLLFFEIPANLLTPGFKDIAYIIILAVLCTAIPFLISIEIMKSLTPFTVNLTLNLEIVYAISMAHFIFGEKEQMTTTFYLCSGLIICLVLSNEMVKKRKIKHQQTIN